MRGAQTSRRGFLFGVGATVLAAPAVIRIPGLLMPIRKVIAAQPRMIAEGFGYAAVKSEGQIITYDASLTIGVDMREVLEAGARSYWIRAYTE